jgi:outer membrane usher protein
VRAVATAAPFALPFALCLALSCALFVPLAQAQALGEPEDGRAPLEIVLNGEPRGVWIVRLAAGDLWVPRRELLAARVKLPAGARREGSPPDERVSLASLGADVAFAVDLDLLLARIDFRPALLAERRLDLAADLRPPGLELRSDLSAFANYAATVATPGTLALSTEAGVSREGAVLSTQASLLTSGALVRGLTNLTLDDPRRLLRWTLGDTFETTAMAGGLWGSALLGGLSVGRDRAQGPYRLYAPLPSQRGFAASPSTLDIYVDGALVRSVPIAPGAFDLQNLPVPAGSSTLRTVLRDAYGRTQELSTTAWYSAGLLAEGFTDWSASAGWQRLQFGAESNAYGPPAALGAARRGLSSWLTAGARVEAAGGGLFNFGASVTAAAPAALLPGTLELAAAASRDGGPRGGALSISYSLQSSLIGTALLLRLQSPAYANVSLPSGADRARWLLSSTSSFPLGRSASLSLDVRAQALRDAGRSAGATLRAQFGLGPALSASASLGLDSTDAAPATVSASLGLLWVIDPVTSADAVASDQGGARGAQLGVQRNLPAGTGLGYRARIQQDEGATTLSALGQAQGQHGRVEAGLDQGPGSTVAHGSLVGGVVAMGGRVFFTRPLEQAWALVQVPGVEGVRGLLENQEAGRTDPRGDLLVPGLRPYYANRLALVPTDVPLTHDVGAIERLVGPPARGGVIVRFAVEPLSAVAGAVVAALPGGALLVPAFGELRVAGAPRGPSSPLGEDGRFFLEGLQPGRYRGQVTWMSGACDLALEVPARRDGVAVTELGVLRCTADTVP